MVDGGWGDFSVISNQLSVISEGLGLGWWGRGSSRFCVISLTYIGSIFVSFVSGVVRSTPSPARLYLRIHFTHQTWERRGEGRREKKADQ